MPYKDKHMYDEMVKRIYYPTISIRLRRSEPEIFDALDCASKKSNLSKGEYSRIALIEKLTRDGFLEQEQSDNPPA